MLILVAHGSRDPLWRAPLEELARSLDERLTPEPVRVAFMQFTGPTLAEVAEEAVSSGEGRVRILPLFMASAGHVEKDIRPVVDQLAESFPEVHIELLPPVGEDPLFPGFITEIAERPSGEADSRGPTGEANSRGPSGEADSRGPSGEADSRGPTGEANSRGPTGEADSRGPSGEANSRGPSSKADSRGPSGETASKWLSGESALPNGSGPGVLDRAGTHERDRP